MTTTPEQLQAWREEFESTINLTHMNQVNVREKMVYFDRELECHWQGYLRRCQETEQAIKDARKQALEDFSKNLYKLKLNDDDICELESDDSSEVSFGLAVQSALVKRIRNKIKELLK